MCREINIILAVLLFFTILLSNDVLAKVAKDPYSLLRELGRSTCSIFRTVTEESTSVTKIAVKGIPENFPKVKGKLVLLAPTDRSLSGPETEIFKGNDESINIVKVINLEGTNTGKVINLSGIGKSSEGYSFSSNLLGFKKFCMDPKRRKRKEFLYYSILPISISFKDTSISTDADVFSPGLKLIVRKNKATVKGGIETNLGEGRFKLIYTK